MTELGMHRNKIVIVGPPNVGKSTIFNKFSRSYSIVSNYPQTTIESFRKESSFAGGTFEIIDSPGVFSLATASEDEKVTVGILVDEHPELLLFCGDATNLKRTLMLLSQVAEMGLPTVFCLNKIDEAGRRGITIDQKKLAEEVKIPTVLTAGIHGTGLKEVEYAARNAGHPQPLVPLPPYIEEAVGEIRVFFPRENLPSKGVILLYLLEDTTITAMLEAKYGRIIVEKAAEARRALYLRFSLVGVRQAIFNARERWADSLAESVTVRKALDLKSPGFVLAQASRTPFTGIPILIGVLWVVFYSVGTISAKIAAFLDAWLFIPFVRAFSPLIPGAFLREFLVGDFGIVTMGVINAVGTVIPILLVFFILINFLEEVGYLPNVAVLTNRLMRPFGLSGKAVLPMVLGFGCNTMATVATRMLETKKERLIASFLIALGFPCAVQLGIIFAILSTMPFSALLILIGAITVTQIAAGVVMNRLIPAKRRADFIMELPSFTRPNWRNIVVKTYFRIKWFLVEVLPMFVAASVLMFALQRSGLLVVIEHLLHPVITGLLSLPEKAAEVFILVLARREVGAVLFKQMVDGKLLDYYQTVVGLVVITLFIPCVSNTMVMVKELGVRWAVAINAAIIVLAILVGGVVNIALRIFPV